MIDVMSKNMQQSRKNSVEDFSRFDALPDSTIALLSQFHQINPNPNKQELRTISQSLHPPLSEQMISEWFAAANGDNDVSSTSIVEDKDKSVESQIRSLLAGPDHTILSDIKQVGRFSRIMNKASDNDSDIKRCLHIICNTKSENCLLAFVSGKGMNVLDNWTKTFGLKGDENSLHILQTLDVLPFVLQIFQNFLFGKYVKKMSKIGSPECKRIAENIMEKWTKRTQEQMINPVKIPETILTSSTGGTTVNKRPVSAGKSSAIQDDAKKIKTSSAQSVKVASKKVTVDTKRPVSAIGSFDIFSKLSSGAAVPATKTKKPSPVNAKPSEVPNLLSVFNHEEGAALKKGRGLTPYIARNIELDDSISVSYKAGGEKVQTNTAFKKKKSVKFRPDTNLMDIRYFSMDDTPASINERSSEIPKFAPIDTDMHLVVDLLQPQIPWTTLRELMLPNFTLYRVDSREISKQERREKSVVSFVSLDDHDIPFSPGEPDVEEFTGRADLAPIFWPLNTMIPYGTSAPSLVKTLDIGLLQSFLLNEKK